MNKQENINEERCDDKTNVFNTTIPKGSVIISQKKYDELMQELETRRKITQGQSEANAELHLKLADLEKENKQLKEGVINFIKGLGGYNANKV